MCELLAQSAAEPIAPKFADCSFDERGEFNSDGWGMAWYPDRSLAIVKEPVKWRASPLAAFMQSYPAMRSSIYIAHVREKTAGGAPTHADTHPFAREMHGREYCFAHNGTLHGASNLFGLRRFRPVGSTDSEHFFCHLLGELETAGGDLSTPESWHWLRGLLVDANRLGQLNCLLSDGERLICYHDRAAYKGLHRSRVTKKRGSRSTTGPQDADGSDTCCVITTRPLSEQHCDAFGAGELAVFEDGELRFSSERTSRTNIG